eukprot:CAMPEP_0195522940 /NCGR_PEP_ID=MMETSP0794_2-20130614/21608_1 /TAXON_ID=515487 /ORGANISM="Stephanopyxis turris, Strain CCMP 815" /LENGTH=254 /DNA_ID=CAMNT_0040652823 /DNA_START=89 /DNA_END=849 /DNA_ORIENTATION=+
MSAMLNEALMGGGDGGNVAQALVQSKIDSLQAEMGLESEKEEQERLEKERKKKEIKTKILYAVVGTSFGISMFCMWLLPTNFIWLTMAFPLILGPTTVHQRHKISKMDLFREVHNEVRNEVDRLRHENSALTENVDQLEKEVGRLKRVEDELSGIVSKQGTTVEKFKNLVKENGETQVKVREILKEKALQSLMEVVISSDRDGDFQLGPTELQVMILKMKNLHGIIFNEAKFIEVLKARSKGASNKSSTSLDIA